jgi:hypothetical protein
MLDCGAHVVLIDDALVGKLGLCRFCLHKPLPISVALNNLNASENYLHECVKIVPFALNSAWTSCTVKAVVTLNLCVPILLRIPFLTANCIVTDFKDRTAIDKMNGYDLLNTKVIERPKSQPDPRKVITDMKKNKCLMLTELVEVCKLCLADGKMVPKFVKPLDVAGMIKEHVENLCFQEKVGKIEKQILTEFGDVFQPLPHVDKLPWNVTAKIKLKDTEQTIKTCTYVCPQKFRDAWKTLIQEHLYAGHIWPSSSPHASPAFIILNADPSVLPRWVNDYRQLNRNTVMDSHPLPRIDDILNNCPKSEIWGTIDMTNSFFRHLWSRQMSH